MIGNDMGIPHNERVNIIGEVGAITGGIWGNFLVLSWPTVIEEELLIRVGWRYP